MFFQETFVEAEINLTELIPWHSNASNNIIIIIIFSTYRIVLPSEPVAETLRQSNQSIASTQSSGTVKWK